MDPATFHQKVVALLSKPKTFAGIPTWRPDRGGTVHLIRVSLIIDGVVRTDLALSANAPTHLSPQPITLQLMIDGRPVERVESLAAAHSNRLDRRVPTRQRGLHLPAGSNHLHPWELNHSWRVADNLPIADVAPFDSDPASVIRFALSRWSIADTLSLPPHEPRLNL